MHYDVDAERPRHDHEIKVRLTSDDMAFLCQLASRNGLPPAVLARLLIKRALNQGAITTGKVAEEKRKRSPA
jgi:predicted DNA binding CopG/RHH family protein